MRKYIRPSTYAKITGINYRTAIKHYHKGYVKGHVDENTGSIWLENPEHEEDDAPQLTQRAILYARVSSTTNKASLDGQLERMGLYAAAKGYTIIKEVKEIASGLNDNRPKLNSILRSKDWDILLVEHRDRLTRFGFNYFTILEQYGKRVESINTASDKDEDLMLDFISIITSFCGRIYGRNRKARTNAIIREVEKNEG